MMLFSSSASRWKVPQDNTNIFLYKLSDTRWSARIDAVKPLVKTPKEFTFIVYIERRF